MFEKETGELKNYLYTFDQFNLLIKDDIIEHIYNNSVKIDISLLYFDNTLYHFGIPGDGEASQVTTHTINDQFRITIRIWDNPQRNSIDPKSLKILFSSFWNTELCDPETGIVSYKSPRTEAAVTNTINMWKESRGKLACTNIQISSISGDDSYQRDILRLLFENISRIGIVIHIGALEFDIIYTVDDDTEIVHIEHLICEKLKKMIPSDCRIRIGGIFVNQDKAIQYSDLHSLARSICDKDPNSPTKPNILLRVDNGNNTPVTGCNSFKVALLRCINNVSKKNLFHNTYLDYIFEYVSQYSISGDDDLLSLRNSIEALLQYINYQNCEESSFRCSCIDSIRDSSHSIRLFEIALSILKGILANKYSYKKKVGLSIDENIEISVNGSYVFLTNRDSNIEKYNWECESNTHFQNDKYSRDTIVIRSSTECFDIPEDLFYDVVVVDGRPTLGGALPDFWAAPFSSLITSMEANINFKNIILWGCMDHIKEIHYLLTNIDNWKSYDDMHPDQYMGDETGRKNHQEEQLSIQYIAHKTFLGYEKIYGFKKKYSGNVFSVSKVEDLLTIILDNNNPLSRLEAHPTDNCINRIINRELRYDSIKLDIFDGIRTTNLSVAFPTVIEIIRNQYSKNGERNVFIDRSGRKLYEIDNFKIVLLNPLSDQLPEYYRYDAADLQQYYNDSFGSGSGLFRYKMEEKDQLQHALMYIKNCLNNNDFAGRRAIIIIPNDNHSEEDYSPLGLVSIQITPRKKCENIIVDVSYTWRTVEALVGLPYSLYGSVEFSKYLCSEINTIMQSSNIGKVQLGKVSYNAYSLHMFIDLETENIARSIVNEATR